MTHTHTHTNAQVLQEGIQKYSKCAKPLRVPHYFATNSKLVGTGVERINRKRLKDIQLGKRGKRKDEREGEGGGWVESKMGGTKDKIGLMLFYFISLLVLLLHNCLDPLARGFLFNHTFL